MLAREANAVLIKLAFKLPANNAPVDTLFVLILPEKRLPFTMLPLTMLPVLIKFAVNDEIAVLAKKALLDVIVPDIIKAVDTLPVESVYVFRFCVINTPVETRGV